MKLTRIFFPLLAIALYGLLLSIQCYKAFHTSLYFDDSFYAIVAKNLTLGRGYAANYFDQIVRFDIGITLGPVLILPTAAMMAIFGNTYWVPSMAAALCSVPLFLCSFYLLRRIEPHNYWQIAATFLLLALLLSNYKVVNPQPLFAWHALQGEIASVLLIIISTLCLASNPYRSRTVFCAGLIAGLAVMCKLVSLIAIVTLGAYLAILYYIAWQKKAMTPAKTLHNFLLYAGGLLLPIILFEAVKYYSLGPTAYTQTAHAKSHWINNWNSFSGASAYGVRFYVLGQYMGIFPQKFSQPRLLQLFIFAGFLLGSVGLWLRHFDTLKNNFSALPPVFLAAGALLSCALVHGSWYIFISSVGLPRYLVPPILYGCASCALFTGYYTTLNPQKGYGLFLLLALLVITMRTDAVLYFFAAFKPEPMLTQQQESLHRLITLRQQNPATVFFACGNSLETEYLLPGTNNFINCDRMFESNFKHRSSILFTHLWIDNKGKPLYISTEKVTGRDIPAEVIKQCPTYDLYRSPYYLIASCKPL